MNQLIKSKRSKSGSNGNQPCPNNCADHLNRNNQNACDDLTRTPEHLRPGFRGQVPQYNPQDFGLTGNEQWRNPRMFRDMTYETDAAAMETFRQAQPQRRQPCPADINISDLPEECLADLSPPGFDLSMESQMSSAGAGTEHECLDDVTPPCLCDDASKARTDKEITNYMDCVYNEISGRFKRLRAHLWCNTPQEKCEENNEAECVPCDQNDMPASPNEEQCENLADQSMPSFQQSRLEDESMPCGNETVDDDCQQPIECNESLLQNSKMQQKQEQSMPSQNLWDESAPSMANSTREECLEDITMPSFEGKTPKRGQRSKSSSRCPNERYTSSFARSRCIPKTSESLGDLAMTSFGGVIRSSSPNGSLQQGRRPMTNECLDDVTMPSCGGTPVSRTARQRTARRELFRGATTNECLDDMTMPSFAEYSGASRSRSRGRQQRSMTNECLDDMTMPSFGGVSDSSRRSCPGQQNKSLTNECLQDMTMPSYGASRDTSLSPQQRCMIDEVLDDMTMPSFAEVSGICQEGSLSMQQRSMIDECLDDITMPSLGEVSGPARAQCPGRQQSTNECLEDMTMPSFEDVSRCRGPSIQQRSITNECLDDMTMPSFGNASGSPRAKSPNQKQRSMTNKSRGARASKGKSRSLKQKSMTNECLEDMTMPSYGEVSTGRSPCRQHRSSANECLEDVTMPCFEEVSGISRCKSPGRMQRSMTNECLEDVTMPSFGEVSGPSRAKCPDQKQRSMTNKSRGARASKGKSRSLKQKSMTNECLEDMTMPSYGDVSTGRSPCRQRRSSANECLEDMTMPTFGEVSGISRGKSPGRMQRSMTNECLEDVTMPSFGEVSGPSRAKCPDQKQRSITNKSRGARASKGKSRSLKQKSMTNECLEDMTMPSYGDVSTGRSPCRQLRSAANECLEDMTMPSFGEVSGSSRAQCPDRMQTSMTNECLEDVTMPSFERASLASRDKSLSRLQRSLINKCLDDLTKPSFNEISGECEDWSLSPQQRSMIDERLDDMTMPSFEDVSVSSRSKCPEQKLRSMTNECLDDMTMPSYKDASRGRSPSRQQRSMTNECLDDMTMPSFGEVSGSTMAKCPDRSQRSRASRGKCPGSRQRSVTNECLDDMTPSYGEVSTSRSPCRQQRSAANECLDDVTMPSFADDSESSTPKRPNQTRRSMTNESRVARASRGKSPGPRQRSMANECLEDVTMPSYGEVPRCNSPCRQQRSAANELLDDVTMPSFADNSGSSTAKCPDQKRRSMTNESRVARASRGKSPGPRQRSITNECLDDMTMPSYGEVSTSRSPCRQQRSAANECLDDVTMPYFADDSESYTPKRPNPNRSSITSGSKVPRPSRGKSPGPRRRSMENEYLEDVTMPSFANDSGSTTPKCPDQTRRSMINESRVARAPRGKSPGPRQRSMANECLEDVTMPSYGEVSTGRSPCRQRSAANECLDDVTMPSYGEVVLVSRSKSPGRMQRSLTNECLDDMTMPSYRRVSVASTERTLSRLQRSMIDECLDEITMPSIEDVSGSSRSKSPCRQQRSMTNKCLDDMTMPSCGEASQVSRGKSLGGILKDSRWRDCKTPRRRKNSTVGSSGRGALITGDECLENVTMPSFGSSGRYDSYMPSLSRRGAITNECLEDMTMPSYAGVSGSVPSRGRSLRQQQRMSMTNECLEDMTMPSFCEFLGSSGRGRCCKEGMGIPSSTRHRRTYSTPPSMISLADREGEQFRPRLSAPCIQEATPRRSRRMTDECLEDVSMPRDLLMSYNESKSVARRAPDISYPSQQLADESAPPSFQNQTGSSKISRCPGLEGSGGRLEDVTMPSLYDEPSYNPCQTTMTSERLEDISDPCRSVNNYESDSEAFFESSAPPMSSTRSEKPKSKTTPGRAEQSRTKSKKQTVAQRRNENCLPTITDTRCEAAPKVTQITIQSTSSSVTRTYENPGNSYGQERIDDMSMPTFEPSFNSTLQAEPDDQSCHGFSSMENYAPFNELVPSRDENSKCNESQPPCPEKASGSRQKDRNNRSSRGRDSGASTSKQSNKRKRY